MDVHTITTVDQGKWCAYDLVVGDAIVDVDETSLPAGAVLMFGTDPEVFTIIAGEVTDAGYDIYTF